jgi:hypothetical protein
MASVVYDVAKHTLIGHGLGYNGARSWTFLFCRRRTMLNTHGYLVMGTDHRFSYGVLCAGVLGRGVRSEEA